MTDQEHQCEWGYGKTRCTKQATQLSDVKSRNYRSNLRILTYWCDEHAKSLQTLRYDKSEWTQL